MSVTLMSHELSVRFGGHVAVNAVSAKFHAGELTAIVGPNGAGKTTYFNLLSGQIKASSGRVFLHGRDISRTSVPVRADMGIGRAFQLTNLFPRLTVLENVRLAVQSRENAGFNIFERWRSRADLIEQAHHYLDMVGLSSRAQDITSSLPHGDKRKLEVALLTALEPKVMMFDEPTAGMSVDEVPVILEMIHRLKSEGNRTILLVEHKLDVIRSLADRIIVLNNGAMVADGTPTEVMSSDVVREAYMGAKSTQEGAVHV